MRKHNEGYALVLVLVVLIVLALLATTILTSAQRNLEVHKHGIQYMENKYQAQGEIEKFLGQLEKFSEPVELTEVTEGDWLLSYNEDEGRIFITSICDGVQIDCTIQIAGGVINEGFITSLEGYSYTTYEISTNGGGN